MRVKSEEGKAGCVQLRGHSLQVHEMLCVRCLFVCLFVCGGGGCHMLARPCVGYSTYADTALLFHPCCVISKDSRGKSQGQE